MKASARRAEVLAVLAVFAAAVVGFAGVLVGGDTLADARYHEAVVPVRAAVGDAIASGRLPEWWPATDLGIALAARPETGAMYPPLWVCGALPMPWAADAVLVLHAALAGIGTALLSRRLGAGAVGAGAAGGAIAAGGAMIAALARGAIGLSLAWLPLALWAGDRAGASATRGALVRRAAALTAILGASALAGDLAVAGLAAALAAGAALARAPRRRPVALALVAAALGAGVLSAVVWAPALGRGQFPGQGGDGFHPLRLAALVWPGIAGDAGHPPASLARALSGGAGGAASVYVSAPVVLLAALAAWRSGAARAAALAAAALVAASLGDPVPAFRTLGLATLGIAPGALTVAAAVLATAAAGVGLGAATRPSRQAIAIAASAAIAVAGAVAAFAATGRAWAARVAEDAARLEPPVDPGRVADAALAGGIRAAVAAALAAVAIALCARPRWRIWAAPLLAAVVAGHLVAEGWQAVPRAPRAAVSKRPAILAGVDAAPGAPAPRLYRARSLPAPDPGDRIARLRRRHDTAAPNAASRFGFAYARGASGRPELEAVWRAAGAAGERLLDLVAVDYAIVPRSMAVATGMPVAGRAGGAVLVANDSRRPRAFVAPRWSWHADEAAVIAALFGPAARGVSLGAVKLIGAGENSPPATGPEPAPACDVTSTRPERVRLSCRSDVGGYAVLLGAWAPGWRAEVNGERVPVERADLVGRAVRVGPGRQEVTMTYRTPGLRLGGIVSLLGWLNLAALATLRRRP